MIERGEIERALHHLSADDRARKVRDERVDPRGRSDPPAADFGARGGVCPPDGDDALQASAVEDRDAVAEPFEFVEVVRGDQDRAVGCGAARPRCRGSARSRPDRGRASVRRTPSRVGRESNAGARPTRCRLPLESALSFLPVCSAMPTVSITRAHAAARSAPRRQPAPRGAQRVLRAPVERKRHELREVADTFAARQRLAACGRPCARPRCPARENPSSIAMSVLLPAPFGPAMPTTSPAPISSERSTTARTAGRRPSGTTSRPTRRRSVEDPQESGVRTRAKEALGVARRDQDPGEREAAPRFALHELLERAARAPSRVAHPGDDLLPGAFVRTAVAPDHAMWSGERLWSVRSASSAPNSSSCCRASFCSCSFARCSISSSISSMASGVGASSARRSSQILSYGSSSGSRRCDFLSSIRRQMPSSSQ